MRTFDCVQGQAIVIGEKIVIRVMELGEDEVCLEISAPEDAPISSKEALDAVVSR